MSSSDNPSQYNSERIRLRVLGISYSQIQAGAYALILAQTDGPYRIPVVVGAAEAQSIAIKMEGIIPPRPMTHDLFSSLAQAYGIELKDVFIHKFEDGIFSSELTFENRNGQEVVLDARTSDAIAIAMRTHTPIFTTKEILEETGFIMEIKDGNGDSENTDNEPKEDSQADILERKSEKELERMLQEYIRNEEYEKAAQVKAALSAKKNMTK